MKKIALILLILMFVIVFTACKNIELPEKLKNLYDYKWQMVQDESEPESYLFKPNGKLYISGYSYNYMYNWSEKDGSIFIYYNEKTISYYAEIFEDEKGVKYLKLGGKLLISIK